MAQYITLEEAAERLGMPPDDFKRRLKTEWTHVVPMRDGPTLRFRVNQIDELARQLGAASDVSLPLAGLEPAEPGSDDFKVQGTTKPAKAAKPADEPLPVFDASDDDIFSLSADEPKPAGKGSKANPPGTDSDVRLEAPKPPKDPEVVPTEEIALDLGGPGSAVIKGGSSAKLSAPKSSTKLTGPDSGMKLSAGDSGKKPDSGKKLSAGDSGKHPASPGLGDSSEFELSLDADSDDFELQLNTDSSDEVDLGSSPVEEGGNRSGKSGLNLRNPGDAGISLEKGKKGDSDRKLAAKKSDSDRKLAGKKPAKSDESDSDVEFELSLDPGPSSGPQAGGPRSSGKPAPLTSDSDSEFELTLDDSSEGASLEAAALESAEVAKGDIFETDFEIPPMTDESGSEAVAIDSDTDLEDKSDIDIALEEGDAPADDTASQVVLLEDEGESPSRKSTSRGGGDVDLADVELEEEGDSVSAAMRKVKHRDDDDEEEVTTVAGVAAPTPWGPVPALILAPAFILVIFGGLMSFELLHTMMGYQQPRKPAAPIVRGVAKMLDMDLKDQ